MNKNDDFTQQVTSKLNGLANEHRNKAAVMHNVLENIHAQPVSRFYSWKITGFAVAAAITGFAVIPNAFNLSDQPHNQQVIVSPKLSPQMMEDLEMLSVFGEDKPSHDS